MACMIGAVGRQVGPHSGQAYVLLFLPPLPRTSVSGTRKSVCKHTRAEPTIWTSFQSWVLGLRVHLKGPIL